MPDFPIPPTPLSRRGDLKSVNQIGKENRAQKMPTYGAMVVREGRSEGGNQKQGPNSQEKDTREVSSASSTWEGDPVNERVGQP